MSVGRKNWVRHGAVALAAVCAALAAYWVPGASEAKAWGRHDGCLPVFGTFDSEQVPPDQCASPVGFCTTGSLTGLLSGTYDFTMTQATPADASVPGIMAYSGTSLIHTRGGQLITATDTGTIDLAPDRWGNFVSLITILDGTGLFEGVRGQLALRGKVDLATGGASGNFKATLCFQH